jgi:hypothetical protein
MKHSHDANVEVHSSRRPTWPKGCEAGNCSKTQLYPIHVSLSCGTERLLSTTAITCAQVPLMHANTTKGVVACYGASRTKVGICCTPNGICRPLRRCVGPSLLHVAVYKVCDIFLRLVLFSSPRRVSNQFLPIVLPKLCKITP